jgi:hypothetical protein
MIVAIGRYYDDVDALTRASVKGAAIVDEHFSADAVGGVLRQNFMPRKN